MLVDGFEADDVQDSKSTEGTTNPNTRRPLKDGYHDHGQNRVEYIALMFGPGTRPKVARPEAPPPILPLGSHGWMSI